MQPRVAYSAHTVLVFVRGRPLLLLAHLHVWQKEVVVRVRVQAVVDGVVDRVSLVRSRRSLLIGHQDAVHVFLRSCLVVLGRLQVIVLFSRKLLHVR